MRAIDPSHQEEAYKSRDDHLRRYVLESDRLAGLDRSIGGHYSAVVQACAMSSRNERVGLDVLCLWQSRMVGDVKERGVVVDQGGRGVLRGDGNEIEISRGNHRGIPAVAVGGEMRRWLDRYAEVAVSIRAESERFSDQIGAVAELMVAFARLLPFADANGRVGRLLAAMLLMSGDRRPAPIFRFEDRRRLHDALGSEGRCSRYLAEKLREAMYCLCGSVTPRVLESHLLNDQYRCSVCGRTITAQHHDLGRFFVGAVDEM